MDFRHLYLEYDQYFLSLTVVESSVCVWMLNVETCVIAMCVPYRLTRWISYESDVGSHEGVSQYVGAEENDVLFIRLADHFMEGLSSSQALITKLL